MYLQASGACLLCQNCTCLLRRCAIVYVDTGAEGEHTAQWSPADVWCIQGLQQASAEVLETAG